MQRHVAPQQPDNIILSILNQPQLKDEDIAKIADYLLNLDLDENILNDQKLIDFFEACLDRFPYNIKIINEKRIPYDMNENQYNSHKKIIEFVLQQAIDKKISLDWDTLYCKLVEFLLSHSTLLFDQPRMGHILALYFSMPLSSVTMNDKKKSDYIDLQNLCYKILLDDEISPEEMEAAKKRLLQIGNRLEDLHAYNQSIHSWQKALGKTYQDRCQELQERFAEAPEKLAEALSVLEKEKDHLLELENKIKHCKVARDTRERELDEIFPVELPKRLPQLDEAAKKLYAVAQVHKIDETRLLFLESGFPPDTHYRNAVGALFERVGAYAKSYEYSLQPALEGNIEAIKRLARIYDANECRAEKDIYYYAARCAYEGIGCNVDVHKAIEIVKQGAKLGSTECADYFSETMSKVNLPRDERIKLARQCLQGEFGNIKLKCVYELVFFQECLNDLLFQDHKRSTVLSSEQIAFLAHPKLKGFKSRYHSWILDNHPHMLSAAHFNAMAEVNDPEIKRRLITNPIFYTLLDPHVGLGLVRDPATLESIPCLEYLNYVLVRLPITQSQMSSMFENPKLFHLEKYPQPLVNRFYTIAAIILLINDRELPRDVIAGFFENPTEDVLSRMKINNKDKLRKLIALFRLLVSYEEKKQPWSLPVVFPLDLPWAERLYQLCNTVRMTGLSRLLPDSNSEFEYYHSSLAKFSASVFARIRRDVEKADTAENKNKIAEEFVTSIIVRRIIGPLSRDMVNVLLLLTKSRTVESRTEAFQLLENGIIKGDKAAFRILCMYILAKQDNYRDLMLRIAKHYYMHKNLDQRIAAAFAFDNEAVTELDATRADIYHELNGLLSPKYKLDLLRANFDKLKGRFPDIALKDKDIALEVVRNPLFRKHFDLATLLTIYKAKDLQRWLPVVEQAAFIQYCIENYPAEVEGQISWDMCKDVMKEVKSAAGVSLSLTWDTVVYVKSGDNFFHEFADELVKADLNSMRQSILNIERNLNIPGLFDLLQYFQAFMSSQTLRMEGRYLPISFNIAARLYHALHTYYRLPNKEDVLSLVRCSAFMAVVKAVEAAATDAEKSRVFAQAMTHPLFGLLNDEQDVIQMSEATAVFLYAEIKAGYKQGNKAHVIGLIRKAGLADFETSEKRYDKREIDYRSKNEFYAAHRKSGISGMNIFGLHKTDSVKRLEKLKEHAVEGKVKLP